MSENKNNWPLWEVFVRSRQGLGHKHVGSLHAADAEMAIGNARDVYTRRQEGVSIWVIPAEQITASSPDDSEADISPADSQPVKCFRTRMGTWVKPILVGFAYVWGCEICLFSIRTVQHRRSSAILCCPLEYHFLYVYIRDAKARTCEGAQECSAIRF